VQEKPVVTTDYKREVIDSRWNRASSYGLYRKAEDKDKFNFELPSVTITQRSRKFANKYRMCDNALCKSFVFR